jgi:hypothetical protein
MKKIWQTIQGWFKREPKFEVDEKHKVVPAFEMDGVQYYQFADINNMMTGRAFVAMDYYNELSMRCTREYLVEHCDAMEKVLSGDSINVINIAQLHTQLKERLEMILQPDIVYKIASVVYFDESEQPYTYDFKYNQKKIEQWKSKGMDFFLQIPLNELIPSLDLSEVDLKNYMIVADKVNRKHLENISTLKFGKTKKRES